MTDFSKKLQGGIEYNDVALNDDWAIPSLALALYSGGTSLAQLLKEPVKKYSSELLLNYGKPLFKMVDNKLKSFGKIGKQYYKNNINPYVDYSKVLDDYLYYPNTSAGKPDAKYNEQFPSLRKNAINSTDKIFLKNNKERTDSDGFYNLKVNFRGKDYAYQYKKNKYNGHNEFHNIKPYGLVEDEYNYQYFNDLFKNILENDY